MHKNLTPPPPTQRVLTRSGRMRQVQENTYPPQYGVVLTLSDKSCKCINSESVNIFFTGDAFLNGKLNRTYIDERLPIFPSIDPFSNVIQINCLNNEGDQIVKNKNCNTFNDGNISKSVIFNYLILNKEQKTLKIDSYSPVGKFQNTINYANNENKLIFPGGSVVLKGSIRWVSST
jgi:hypothetical protein